MIRSGLIRALWLRYHYLEDYLSFVEVFSNLRIADLLPFPSYPLNNMTMVLYDVEMECCLKGRFLCHLLPSQDFFVGIYKVLYKVFVPICHCVDTITIEQPRPYINIAVALRSLRSSYRVRAAIYYPSDPSQATCLHPNINWIHMFSPLSLTSVLIGKALSKRLGKVPSA